MKCLEANLVNEKENTKVALNLIREFKKSYKQTAKEIMDDNKWEQELTIEKVEEEYSSNFVFKCKIPNG